MGIFFANLEDFSESTSTDKLEESEGGGREWGSRVFRGVVGVCDLDTKSAGDIF